ncbi:hypothetical protein RFI_20011 [Reticulomyxa filosa]|uniref:Uncharacterized protein n=1 Tax=Reticulomyxa filosa TaxID=46433 RepID=X6MU01_RETFI|nr:hypothetical protein RFI_20011 [Reticulomyxa filosa]|eukprot:ETO17314.1 hypothetical protein RFI_20011 [Reticulomyxa filosa]
MLDQDASVEMDYPFIVCVYTSKFFFLNLFIFYCNIIKTWPLSYLFFQTNKKKMFEDDIELSQRRDSNEKIDMATNNEEEEEKLNETQIENEHRNRPEDPAALEGNAVIRTEATDNGLAVAVLQQTLKVTPIEYVSPLLQVDAECVATIQQKYQAKLTATFGLAICFGYKFFRNELHNEAEKKNVSNVRGFGKVYGQVLKTQIGRHCPSEMSEDEKNVHEC